MSDEQSYTCGKARVGYAGQRYEVRFDEDGKERVAGWTDRPDGEPLVRSINLHPVWTNPRVIDLLNGKEVESKS